MNLPSLSDLISVVYNRTTEPVSEALALAADALANGNERAAYEFALEALVLQHFLNGVLSWASHPERVCLEKIDTSTGEVEVEYRGEVYKDNLANILEEYEEE